MRASCCSRKPCPSAPRASSICTVTATRSPGCSPARSPSRSATMLDAALQRVAERRCPGVRLVQATYHTRSLSLYTKLGFEVRELLVAMQGSPLKLHVPGYTVRRATSEDVDECNALCVRVHGHDRRAELVEAIERERTTVVEHANRLTGYATGLGFSGHAVGEGNAALKALIGAASELLGPGFLLPTRNAD